MLKFRKEKKSRDTDHPQGIFSRGNTFGRYWLIALPAMLLHMRQFPEQLAQVAPGLEPGL